MSLHGNSDPALKTQALWTEKVAVALPPESRLIEHPTLCLADLQKYPIYRWQAEVCSLLDEQLAFLTPVGQERILQTTSFEMMALWVRAGYGVGVSAQSRIESARRWGIGMRLLTDSPYEIVVYLQRPHADSMSISERFEERALRVAAASL